MLPKILSARKNRIYRKDGKLVVQFTFANDATLIEMEHEIESLIDFIDDSVTEGQRVQKVRTSQGHPLAAP